MTNHDFHIKTKDFRLSIMIFAPGRDLQRSELCEAVSQRRAPRHRVVRVVRRGSRGTALFLR